MTCWMRSLSVLNPHTPQQDRPSSSFLLLFPSEIPYLEYGQSTAIFLSYRDQ